MYKIFIVEDDELTADVMESELTSWGYEVKCQKDFSDIIPSFVYFSPQIVLLDISLPFHNGFHWCTEIRKISKVPIIFISSAHDNMNIVMAMNMGGDDFIAKPFDMNILIAKIQALLRRSYEFVSISDLIEHNGVILDKAGFIITYRGEKTELTRNELRILQVLMENKETAVSRNELIERLWETDSYIDDNTLTVNINRIRNKLKTIGLTDFIQTKKNFGYMVM